MDGVEAFMFMWDYKTNSEAFYKKVIAAPELLSQSTTGNISDKGTAYSSRVRALTRQNLAFEEFIEPGVRELTSIVVNRHNLITYSSCEGHQYSENSGDQRHVVVIPRDEYEYSVILKGFESVCDQVNLIHADSKIEMVLYLGLLIDGMKEYQVIDLVFFALKY